MGFRVWVKSFGFRVHAPRKKIKSRHYSSMAGFFWCGDFEAGAPSQDRAPSRNFKKASLKGNLWGSQGSSLSLELWLIKRLKLPVAKPLAQEKWVGQGLGFKV